MSGSWSSAQVQLLYKMIQGAHTVTKMMDHDTHFVSLGRGHLTGVTFAQTSLASIECATIPHLPIVLLQFSPIIFLKKAATTFFDSRDQIHTFPPNKIVTTQALHTHMRTAGTLTPRICPANLFQNHGCHWGDEAKSMFTPHPPFFLHFQLIFSTSPPYPTVAFRLTFYGSCV